LLLSKVQEEAAALEEARTSLENTLATTDSKLQQATQELAELRPELAEALKALMATREQLTDCEARLGQQTERVDVLEEQCLRLGEQLASTRDELAEWRGRATKDEELIHDELEPRTRELNSKFDKSKGALREQVLVNRALKKQLTVAEQKNTMTISAMAAFNRQAHDMASELALLRDTYARESCAWWEKMAEDAAKITFLENLRNDLSGSIKKSWQDADFNEKERMRLAGEVHALQAECDSLRMQMQQSADAHAREVASARLRYEEQAAAQKRELEAALAKLREEGRLREEQVRAIERNQALRDRQVVAKENSGLRIRVAQAEVAAAQANQARDEAQQTTVEIRGALEACTRAAGEAMDHLMGEVAPPLFPPCCASPFSQQRMGSPQPLLSRRSGVTLRAGLRVRWQLAQLAPSLLDLTGPLAVCGRSRPRSGRVEGAWRRRAGRRLRGVWRGRGRWRGAAWRRDP